MPVTNKLVDARFYGILDTGYVADADWEAKCLALIAGGADIIQMRAKRQSHRERRDLLQRILPMFVEGSPPLIINDDLELALQYPRLGLHVGQDDIAAPLAREALGADRILGLSTHSVEQARGAIELAAVLDYFAVGPVFATPTKPDYTAVGLELVRSVAAWEAAGEVPLPWFAIGGVNRRTLPDVLEAGARRVVAVSDVLCAEDTAAVVREYL